MNYDYTERNDTCYNMQSMKNNNYTKRSLKSKYICIYIYYCRSEVLTKPQHLRRIYLEKFLCVSYWYLVF